MKKTTIVIVMAVLCFFFKARSQDKANQIVALKTGEPIPESIWNMTFQTVDYQEQNDTFKLSEYKGKLIILDFWATWCSGCIAAMPAIHTVASEFDTLVKVIPVTYEGLEKVLPVMKKSKTLQQVKINTIINDVLLQKFFPHIVIPHYIWITADGKYFAATRPEQITSKNILEVLQKQKTDLKPKIDLSKDKAIFLQEELLSYNQILNYSLVFRGRYDGLSTGHRPKYDSLGNVTGISSTNLPLVELYEQAAIKIFQDSGDKYLPKRRIIDVKDKNKVVSNYTPDTFCDELDLYSYISRTPKPYDQSAYYQMISDLNRYSDYTGAISKLPLRCLVLKRTSNIDKIKTRSQNSEPSDFNLEHKFINKPMSYVISILNNLNISDLPIIDETGYSLNIDIYFPTLPKTIQDLNKELSKYDLMLSLAVKPLLTLVIKDKQSPKVNSKYSTSKTKSK